MNNLFSYGTIQNPKVQKEIFGHILYGVEDSLFGYSKTKIKIENKEYNIAFTGTGGRINGRVYQLSDNELEKVDLYEGNYYRRVMSKLQSGIDAWLYVRA